MQQGLQKCWFFFFVRERMTSWDLAKVDPLSQTFGQVHVLLRNWFVEVKPWACLVPIFSQKQK